MSTAGRYTAVVHRLSLHTVVREPITVFDRAVVRGSGACVCDSTHAHTRPHTIGYTYTRTRYTRKAGRPARRIGLCVSAVNRALVQICQWVNEKAVVLGPNGQRVTLTTNRARPYDAARPIDTCQKAREKIAGRARNARGQALEVGDQASSILCVARCVRKRLENKLSRWPK